MQQTEIRARTKITLGALSQDEQISREMLGFRTTETLPPVPDGQDVRFRISEGLLSDVFIADFETETNAITEAT